MAGLWRRGEIIGANPLNRGLKEPIVAQNRLSHPRRHAHQNIGLLVLLEFHPE